MSCGNEGLRDSIDPGLVVGVAALGAIGGMTVGAAIANENKPTTTAVENYPAYGYQPASYGVPAPGTTVYPLPTGAIGTDIDGTTYFSENGVYYSRSIAAVTSSTSSHSSSERRGYDMRTGPERDWSFGGKV